MKPKIDILKFCFKHQQVEFIIFGCAKLTVCRCNTELYETVNISAAIAAPAHSHTETNVFFPLQQVDKRL